MQKIATRVFIYASVVFGCLGIAFVLSLPARNNTNSAPNIVVVKLLLATGFIVLTSFALSVASKYLKDK